MDRYASIICLFWFLHACIKEFLLLQKHACSHLEAVYLKIKLLRFLTFNGGKIKVAVLNLISRRHADVVLKCGFDIFWCDVLSIAESLSSLLKQGIFLKLNHICNHHQTHWRRRQRRPSLIKKGCLQPKNVTKLMSWTFNFFSDRQEATRCWCAMRNITFGPLQTLH